MRLKKINTVRMRTLRFAKRHKIKQFLADRALWEIEKNPKITDQKAIDRARKFWREFERAKKEFGRVKNARKDEKRK